MKKFKLEITCESAAFGEKPELQLSSILHGVANTLAYVHTIENDRPIKTPITDVNGIRCGTWSLG
jgi:hypothetical protein